MGRKKEASAPLTRWQYFFKTLYHNAAATAEFSYDKRIYLKSRALQDVEQRSARVNYLLLLALIVMFLLTSRYHNIWLVVGYLVLVVAGQIARYCMLPRNITAHLTDSGRMER